MKIVIESILSRINFRRSFLFSLLSFKYLKEFLEYDLQNRHNNNNNKNLQPCTIKLLVIRNLLAEMNVKMDKVIHLKHTEILFTNG